MHLSSRAPSFQWSDTDLEGGGDETRVSIPEHTIGPCKLRLFNPVHRVRKLHLLEVGVQNLHLALVQGGHVHANDLIFVVADGEVQMRVKKCVRAFECMTQNGSLSFRLQL